MTSDLLLETTLSAVRSNLPNESVGALKVLFRQFVNRTETWDALVTFFVERPTCDIPSTFIYFLAHIPWHSDIAWTGDEPISSETRDYGRNLVRERFGRQEMIKLLEFMDEDGISRGSIGQSVVAIVSCLDEIGPTLAGIVRDPSLSIDTRERASLIVAAREGRDAIPMLMELARSGSDSFAWKVISVLRENGRL